MKLLKWFSAIFISWILSLICLLFGWVIVMFADKNANLPGILYIFQSYENTLNGDQGWNNPISHPTINKVWKYDWQNFCWKYIRYYMWLIRNPAQVWDNYYGIRVPAGTTIVLEGNPKVGNQPLVEGFCKMTAGDAWGYYYVKKMPWNDCCLRLAYGYWLMDISQQTTTSTPYLANLKFICNPFMSYTSE